VYAGIHYDIKNPHALERDRIFISHGHTSPGTYAVLAEAGYFPAQEMILEFREAYTRYAGHVEIDVRGVEWGTGNLGQGLSAGAASAFATQLQGLKSKTFVLMGDGEQQKGQLSEARRFALKFGLSNLIGIIDYNGLQIGGRIVDIMWQNIKGEYEADGWNVLEVDGSDFKALYEALSRAYHTKVEKPIAPTMILAHTRMGYGVSFMENKHEYHGKALSVAEAQSALQELSSKEDVQWWIAEKAQHKLLYPFAHTEHPYPQISPGGPRLYTRAEKLDNRSAYGNALADLAKINNSEKPKILALTCDLMDSVKMGGFAKASPRCFLENGIQEHHTATLAGRLSIENFVVFFSTFGVFGTAETYNQLRLSTLNRSHLKLVCTHIGLNVGEDGPTHQSIDYVGLLSNLFCIRVAIPADPNQTDRIIRKIAQIPGNDFVGMGREKAPIILDEKGEPFFGANYEYTPGKADWLRRGLQGTFIAMGPMVYPCLEAHERLKKEGLEIGVLNMASLIPLDKEAILEAARLGPLITAEDHHVQTGLGSLVANVLAECCISKPLAKMGVTHYSSSGKTDKLYADQGLTAENFAKKMKELLEKG
jgi:transketolase